jgi:predicted dehydrogenase
MLNLAYIGTGPISEFHIPALRKVGFNISSVSSRENSENIQKFAQKFNIKNIIPNWHELLDITDSYDAIMLAVDIDATFEILNKLIDIDKPILVEKSVSIKSKEIAKLIQKNNKKVFVAYNRRHYTSTAWAKNFIESKSNVSATFFIPEMHHLNFYYNSSHIIDLMNYFFNDLQLDYTNDFIIGKKLSGFTAVFKTKRGDVINLISNWNAPSNFEIEIIHQDEKIDLLPIEKAYFYKGMQIIEPTTEDPIRKYVPKLIKESKEDKIEENFKPGFYKQARAFYNYVKSNQYDERMCTLKQAKENIEIIEKVLPIKF